MGDCLFCKIINKELEGEIVYEDEKICAFRDKFPDAPVHVLVVPKKHIESLSHVTQEDAALLSDLQFKIAEVAKIIGVADDGYRVITNVGENGRQSVKHLHYHILGGKKLAIRIEPKE